MTPDVTAGERAPWATPVDALAAAFDTHLDVGLTSEEAGARLERDGPNEIAAAPPIPRWVRLGRPARVAP